MCFFEQVVPLQPSEIKTHLGGIGGGKKSPHTSKLDLLQRIVLQKTKSRIILHKAVVPLHEDFFSVTNHILMKFQRTVLDLLFPSSFFSFWCMNVQVRTEEKGLVYLGTSGILILLTC